MIVHCLLCLLVQRIIAHNLDATLNDFSLATFLKEAGLGNNCDVMFLPRDDQECYNAQDAAKRDQPCYLEFGSDYLGHVQVSNSTGFTYRKILYNIHTTLM